MRSNTTYALALFCTVSLSTAAHAVKKVSLNPCASLKDTPNVLNLSMGDGSCDGHCKTETVLVCASETQDAIAKAYTAGVKKLGFDISTEVEEYEDSAIKAKHLQELYKLGAEILFADEIESTKEEFLALDPESEVNVGTNQYALLYLGTAKVKIPSLKTLIIDTGRDTDIGGYGLFSD